MAAQVAEQQRNEKIKRNERLFQRTTHDVTNKSKPSRKPELRPDFLAELQKSKSEKRFKKSEKSGSSSGHTETEKCPELPKKDEEVKKLSPAERLAKLRAEKEAEDKKRLDSIATDKSQLDRADMKLLFSTRW